jgi:uncharacterized protein
MKFLPQQAPIEQFGSGGFRFAGMSHQGSLLVLPSGMRAWRPARWEDVTQADLADVLRECSAIDFLVIGTGETMQRLPKVFADSLKGSILATDCMSTSSAIHTYNVMLAENRRLAAAFIVVDKAHG